MRRMVLVRLVLAFLLVGVITTAGLRQHYQANAAARTQYKVVPITSSATQALQSTLDQYGSEGWELVAIMAPFGGGPHFIFKK